jgi:hypothetical protein
MRKLLLLLTPLLAGPLLGWSAGKPPPKPKPPHPHPTTTTTTTPPVCLDAALMVRADNHDGVAVWYADGAAGPHPVGWGSSDCIHPY